MSRKRYGILASTFALLFMTSPSHAFLISAEDNCPRFQSSSGQTVYGYNFSNSGYSSDYKVSVSSSSFNPDLKIKIVTDPSQANLGLADNLPEADMKVCKTTKTHIGSEDITVIHVSNTSYSADIEIQLSETIYNPDYTLYVDSNNLETEEVAALFAVIWQSRRDEAEEETKRDEPTLEELKADLQRQKAELISKKASIPRQINIHKNNILKLQNHQNELEKLAKINPMKIQEIVKQMSQTGQMIREAKTEIYDLEMELEFTIQALQLFE